MQKRQLVNLSLVFLISIALFGMISCNNGVIYKEYKEINPLGWGYNDDISFSIPIEKAPINYNLELDVKHKDDYPYQNIYVRIATTPPNDTTIEKTVSLELTNHNSLWTGDCSGGSCKLNILLQDHAYFKEKGDYQIKISQFTRDSILVGVEGIGIKLVEIKK